jgi:hypothetical protein
MKPFDRQWWEIDLAFIEWAAVSARVKNFYVRATFLPRLVLWVVDIFIVSRFR